MKRKDLKHHFKLAEGWGYGFNLEQQGAGRRISLRGLSFKGECGIKEQAAAEMVVSEAKNPKFFALFNRLIKSIAYNKLF